MGKVAINLEADIQPVSDFRARASAMLEQVRSSGRPLVLTQRGRSTAVVVDIRAYQAMVDELEILRDIHQGIADANAGRVTEHAELKERLLERYR